MNKTELIREVHERTGKKLSLKDIDLMVDVMLQVMSEKLKSGEEVQLADFGSFSLAKKTIKSIAEK